MFETGKKKEYADGSDDEMPAMKKKENKKDKKNKEKKIGKNKN